MLYILYINLSLCKFSFDLQREKFYRDWRLFEAAAHSCVLGVTHVVI